MCQCPQERIFLATVTTIVQLHTHWHSNGQLFFFHFMPCPLIFQEPAHCNCDMACSLECQGPVSLPRPRFLSHPLLHRLTVYISSSIDNHPRSIQICHSTDTNFVFRSCYYRIFPNLTCHLITHKSPSCLESSLRTLPPLYCNFVFIFLQFKLFPFDVD